MARQVKAGITVVGDGEMSKPSYVSYVTSRLEGFGGSDRGPGVADLAEFPEFAKQQVGSGVESLSGRVFSSSLFAD